MTINQLSSGTNYFNRIGIFSNMIFRTADLSDIKQIQVVRHLVKESILSNPDLVPDKDVAYYITENGKGWVYEVEDRIVGFSIPFKAGLRLATIQMASLNLKWAKVYL